MNATDPATASGWQPSPGPSPSTDPPAFAYFAGSRPNRPEPFRSGANSLVAGLSARRGRDVRPDYAVDDRPPGPRCVCAGGSMLRIHFTAEDLARTSLAATADPLWEIPLSRFRLHDRDRPVAFRPWTRRLRAS